MRILIGHNFYQTPGGEDGVARSEAELLRGFGEEVVVYHRSNSELNGLKRWQRLSHLASLSESKASYRELRDLIRKHRPEVAHFHNIFYMMTPSVYQACHDEGVAVVQSLHNFRMMCSNGLFFRDGGVCEDCLTKNIWEGVKHACFRDSRIMTFAMAATLDRQWRRGTWIHDVDLYIAAAEFTRNKYIQRGIAAEKIVHKPHFLFPDPKPRTTSGSYVLYLGRLSEEKGIKTLLEAWRTLPGRPLKIVGTGPLDAHLRQTAQAQGMTTVEFTGFVDAAKCEDFLRGSAFLVIPSECYENFPRVIVEAFALGVPVVASRMGSLVELVEEGETGLLAEAGNAVELGEKVGWLLANPAEAERMGRNARRMFEQKYSARSNYEKLIQIYQQAISLRQG
jgi:glycosyltransferase involved in cell wall biosynthesis